MSAHSYRWILLIYLLPTIGWAQMPSSPAVQGQFLTDSIEIGRPFQYALAYQHPSNRDVLFPDTATAFLPYHVQKIAVFTTKTTGAGRAVTSRDSAVYTLVSFETDPVQLLRIPVRMINTVDCTAQWTQTDTVFMRSKLSARTTDSMALGVHALVTETAVAPLQQQFNYSELLMGLLLLTGTAILLYGIFGQMVRRQWRLYQLNRRHSRFLKNYNQLSEQLSSSNVSETANLAIIRWKTYMERLDRQPYTSLTTSELAERLNDPQITETLREADRMVYGQTFSPQSQEALYQLRDMATQTYYRRRVMVLQSAQQIVEATADSAEPSSSS